MVEKILIGDILQSKVQTLVNTVNCVGIMGKGIALEFKKHFSEMYKDYKDKCDRNEVIIGEPYIYKGLFPPWVINFPTKKDWRSLSKIKDIQIGLEYIVEHYKEWGIESLAVPPLGCGNGQLDWRDVGPVIFQTLNKIDISVELYAPHGTPRIYLKREFLSQTSTNGRSHPHQSQTLNPAWLALVEILYQLEKQPYHQPVGRTIFHKISYFATALKLPTNFTFQESSFGPFSPDIKRAMTVLANNGYIAEEKKGQMFKINAGPNYENEREKRKDDIQKYFNIINRTVDLFARMNTQQAEIATTIFFSAQEVKKQKESVQASECDILDYVMEWKKRRNPPYKKEEIASAIRNLAILKWVDVKYCNDLPVFEEI